MVLLVSFRIARVAKPLGPKALVNHGGVILPVLACLPVRIMPFAQYNKLKLSNRYNK